MSKAVAFAAVLSILFVASKSPQVSPKSLTLVGGRLYASPDALPLDDAIIVLENGMIVDVGPRAGVPIPANTTAIDCTGLIVTAGFYNNHVHFTDPRRWDNAASIGAERLTADLRDMLTRFGYTSVVDTASDLENTLALRRRIMSGEVPGPRILTAGGALYPPAGVPYYVRDEVPPEIVARLHQPTTAASARAIVRRQMDAGSDLLKLFVGSWVSRSKVLPMPEDVARAAAAEAHARGQVVFAHPSNVAGLEVALRSGVDVLAHALDDTRGMREDHYARLRKQNVGMVPTLALFRGRWSWDILDEVRTHARGGGQVLFGTDVGYLPNFDHAVEYELMASAGLGWREILASLTAAPARRFKEANRRGTIQKGLEADVVVLGTDPAFGARGFADVRYAIRAGTIIFAAPAPGRDAPRSEAGDVFEGATSQTR
jgi:imidazolonepropionase-like amidohydrolase